MQCKECVKIFEEIGNALNTPLETEGLLAIIAETLVERFKVAGCLIRLLSRDRRTLEELASYGLSKKFLQKGPVDPERSVHDAVEGSLVIIGDARSDPRIQYPAAHEEEGFVTLVNVPLKTRGQVIGVLRLYCKEKREFGERELDVLQVVAAFCASAIVHSMFHKVLRHINKTVRSTLDLNERLKAMVEVITEDLRIKGSSIQLIDPSGKLSNRGVSYGLSDSFMKKATDPPEDILATVAKGSVVAILDSTKDSRIPFGSEAAAEGVTSMLFLPLVLFEKTIGILTLCTHRAYELSKDEMSLMRGISDECALAIHNALVFAAAKHQYENLVDDLRNYVTQGGGYFPMPNG